jgi:broad specificity phosphatase PhoE
MQGHLDSALTSTGVTQATLVGQLLKSLLKTNADVVILSSPLGRAMRTAAIISRELGADLIDILPVNALMEANHELWAA